MVSTRARRFADLAPIWLVGLCAVWILAGLTGHDPWKPDEGYTFGVVLQFLEHGDWVVPRLAGEAFVEKPPLYFITAAAFGAAFGHFLPLHDAARLATGFYMAWALLLVALTARELYDGRRGWPAVLILIGCLGLFVRGHQMITDVALFAGIATGMYGLARSRRSARVGGATLGSGALMAFLSKGLLGPGILGLTALALLAFPAWRHRTCVRALALAAVVAVPGIAAWTIALYQRSPDLFHEWLVLNNFGRFLGFSNLGTDVPPFGFYASTLLWHAFPAFPLAAWTVWDATRQRSGAWADPGLQLPSVMLVVMLAVLGASHDARELYLMPALLPLTLLASARIDTLPLRVSTAMERGALWTAIVLATTLWSSWLLLEIGIPNAFQNLVAELQPGFAPDTGWVAVAVALGATASWVYLVRGREPERRHWIVTWAAGTTLCWTLVGTLWLPFLDAGKSYREMIASLEQALPADGCVASRRLGESQRALLEYFAGIITLRADTAPPSPECNAFLVQGWRESGAPAPDFDGVVVWEGARPGDNKELYRLYVRGAPSDIEPVRFPTADSAAAGSSAPLLGNVERSQRRLIPRTGKAGS